MATTLTGSIYIQRLVVLLAVHTSDIDMILLTKDACCRLRDAADDEILTARPLVRVLVIEARAFNRGGGYQVFVTDGQGYAHIAIAPVLAQKLGSGLHIGTVIRLLQATRNPADDPWYALTSLRRVTHILTRWPLALAPSRSNAPKSRTRACMTLKRTALRVPSWTKRLLGSRVTLLPRCVA